MGAGTSAHVEARFPGLVRALILEDPGWRDQPAHREPALEKEEQSRRNPMEWILKLEKMSVDELVAMCRKDNPTWQEAELRPWAESKKQFDYNFLQGPRGNPFANWQEVVKEIHCPTLLITANPAKGGLVTPEAAQWIRATKSNIKVVRIPRTGHNIRRENYEKYIKAVRAFLKEQTR